MRPRLAPPPTHEGPVPPELRVGPCADVWSDDGVDLIAGRRRYGIARLLWEADTGIGRATSYALLPGGRPWRLTDPDGPARLARVGFLPGDIPIMRAAAVARIAHDHRANH